MSAWNLTTERAVNAFAPQTAIALASESGRPTNASIPWLTLTKLLTDRDPTRHRRDTPQNVCVDQRCVHEVGLHALEFVTELPQHSERRTSFYPGDDDARVDEFTREDALSTCR